MMTNPDYNEVTVTMLVTVEILQYILMSLIISKLKKNVNTLARAKKACCHMRWRLRDSRPIQGFDESGTQRFCILGQ